MKKNKKIIVIVIICLLVAVLGVIGIVRFKQAKENQTMNAVAQKNPDLGETTTDTKLYFKADTTSKVLYDVPDKTKFTILSTDSNYYMVTFKGTDNKGYMGYILIDDTRRISNIEKTTQEMNIYFKPDKTSKVIVTIPAGSEVSYLLRTKEYTDNDGNAYYMITYKNEDGKGYMGYALYDDLKTNETIEKKETTEEPETTKEETIDEETDEGAAAKKAEEEAEAKAEEEAKIKAEEEAKIKAEEEAKAEAEEEAEAKAEEAAQITVSTSCSGKVVKGWCVGSYTIETNAKSIKVNNKDVTVSGGKYNLTNEGKNTVIIDGKTYNYNIDKTAPTCTSSGGKSSWVNSDITLVGKCSDSGSGCSKESISITKVYNKDINSTKETPGEVSDLAGNKATCPANQTVKIDKTAPTCTSSGGNSSWVKTNITLKGKCSDSGSGCKSDIEKTYSTDTNSTKETPGEVTDAVGNKTTCPANQTVKIDKTGPNAPTINKIRIAGKDKSIYEDTWKTEPFSLIGTSTDAGAGITYWQYSWDDKAWTTDDKATSKGDTYVFSQYTQSRNQYVYTRACDSLNNCSKSTKVKIKLERTTPKSPKDIGGYSATAVAKNGDATVKSYYDKDGKARASHNVSSDVLAFSGTNTRLYLSYPIDYYKTEYVGVSEFKEFKYSYDNRNWSTVSSDNKIPLNNYNSGIHTLYVKACNNADICSAPISQSILYINPKVSKHLKNMKVKVDDTVRKNAMQAFTFLTGPGRNGAKDVILTARTYDKDTKTGRGFFTRFGASNTTNEANNVIKNVGHVGQIDYQYRSSDGWEFLWYVCNDTDGNDWGEFLCRSNLSNVIYGPTENDYYMKDNTSGIIVYDGQVGDKKVMISPAIDTRNGNNNIALTGGTKKTRRYGVRTLDWFNSDLKEGMWEGDLTWNYEIELNNNSEISFQGYSISNGYIYIWEGSDIYVSSNGLAGKGYLSIYDYHGNCYLYRYKIDYPHSNSDNLKGKWEPEGIKVIDKNIYVGFSYWKEGGDGTAMHGILLVTGIAP